MAYGAGDFQFNAMEVEKQGNVEAGKKKTCTRGYANGKKNARIYHQKMNQYGGCIFSGECFGWL